MARKRILRLEGSGNSFMEFWGVGVESLLFEAFRLNIETGPPE